MKTWNENDELMIFLDAKWEEPEGTFTMWKTQLQIEIAKIRGNEITNKNIESLFHTHCVKKRKN